MKQQTKFKQTEIGKIPENWEVKSLEQVAIFKNGKSSPKRESLRNFPVYGSNGIIGFADETNSEDDTIIIGRVGAYCGSVYFSKIKCWVTDNAIIGNAKNKNSPQFLFYLLKKLDLNQRRGGSSQPLINQSILSSIKVAFPTNELEQSAIAKILSDLDSKIELNREMNKTLEAIGQAIFKHWFVDFEFSNEQGKPYKSSGGEMVDSELGKIPKWWGVKELGDYGTFKNGINYLRNETGDTEFFIANVRDIANNKLLLKESLDKIKIDFKKAKDYLLDDRDILIARSASPGEVSLVLGNLEKVIYSGFSIRYRLNIPSNYLYIFLIMQRLKENLSNFSVGTTLQSVNQETLKNMKFVLPSNETLDKFNKIIGQILEKTYSNLIQSSNLYQIRDSLLPRLMSGKIRVPVEV